jgi:hypothetical protein
MDYRPALNRDKPATTECRAQKLMNMNLVGFVKMGISSKSKANEN